MVSTDSLHTIVGIIGNVISFVRFLSPAPTFARIIKNKSVEEFSPIPYIATVLNSLLWVFYGMPFVHPGNILIVTINSVGFALELIYLAIFFLYADSRGRKHVSYGLFGALVFAMGVVSIALTVFHTFEKRSFFIGVICDVFSIAMYAAPLTIIFKVIKTKSVEYMPFTLSLTTLFNAIVWTSYSLIKFDIYILVSNGLGSILTMIQLVLYGYYYSFGVQEVKKTDAAVPKEIQMV